MQLSLQSHSRTSFIHICLLVLLTPSAFAGSVSIGSPKASSTMPSNVMISASASESIAFHIEVWDNGRKLGDFFSSTVNETFAMSHGIHTTTVQSVSKNGIILNKSNVVYKVASPTPPSTPLSKSVQITSPTAGSTSINAVRIAASSDDSTIDHLEVWDNGYKLGNIMTSSVDDVYVLPSGPHVLTVQAINSSDSVISSSNVSYTVAESCATSRYAQCNLDELPINNVQDDCKPSLQQMWVANGCGAGIQGLNPTFPLATLIAPMSESPTGLPDQGSLTLNGHSIHFQEVQGRAHPSNVLFRGQSSSTVPAGAIDAHWTLDQYVYLPDPAAHQALELDAQYTAGNIWTKFYTECAFNMSYGTGYWAVFDSETGGWIRLNGQTQNGQTPPAVPCNRSQFAQPWSGSSNPSFTGWHHIVWKFLREPDGTVTYESLTFDNTTTPINFKPNSASGGVVADNGNFSALVQLDGVVNKEGLHNVVDVYLSEINLLHTP